MLSELNLSNFRIFNDKVTVRFRPITIFVGRNSSGKSSIIKFLLMLQQSSRPGQSQFLTPEGDKVGLGAFSGLKNSLTKKRTLPFELVAKSPLDQPRQALARYLESFKDVAYAGLLYKASAEVRYGGRSGMGNARYSLVDQNTDRHYLTVNTKILDDSVFLAMPASSGARTELSAAVSALEYPPAPEEGRKRFTEAGKRFTEQLITSLELLARALAESQLSDELRYHVNSIRHLSPVREESQRVISTSYPPVDDVGQRGQYTLPHLQRMMLEDRDRYEFLLPHLESIAGIEGIKFRTSPLQVSQPYARNKTTGADVPISDYGFGVSQCLPILVQGAIMSPYTTLMIEQPEAQLHPTAQLELGSFFADLWNQRQVGSIIETHSDNILLRLRRLIARGDLFHQDVSVAFFTFDDANHNMPIIKNLDINEDGSMEAGLPMEFFGRNIIEGLQLGARS